MFEKTQGESLGSEASPRPPIPDPATGGMHGPVVDWLGRAIANGTLTGVLSPDQLAVELHVSRSLVRECLRTLAAKGMVRAKRRTGTVVTPSVTWSLMDDQVIQWRAEGPERFEQLREALAIREVLEPLAGRLCATRQDAHTNARLQEAAEKIRKASESKDVVALIEADVAFHRELYFGSGNQMLTRLSGPVVACLWVPDLRKYTRFSNSLIDRHQVLADLIAHGKADAAHAEITRQLHETIPLWIRAKQQLSSARKPTTSTTSDTTKVDDRVQLG